MPGLGFVRGLVKDAFDRSRPGLGPVVFFTLQFVKFFEGIRSDRQFVQPLRCTWLTLGTQAARSTSPSSLQMARAEDGCLGRACYALSVASDSWPALGMPLKISRITPRSRSVGR